MKNLIFGFILASLISIACGKQKAKQVSDNEEVTQLEQEIKVEEKALEKLTKEEEELDAINDELEDILKEFE